MNWCFNILISESRSILRIIKRSSLGTGNNSFQTEIAAIIFIVPNQDGTLKCGIMSVDFSGFTRMVAVIKAAKRVIESDTCRVGESIAEHIYLRLPPDALKNCLLSEK